MIMAGCAFFEPLHLSTLLLILGNIFVSLTVSGVSSRDGTLLLLTRLTQQCAQTLNFELELPTVVMIFSNSLGDFLILMFPVVQIFVSAVTSFSQGTDLRLEDDKLVLEVADLAREVTMFGTAVFALANKDLIAFRCSDVSDSVTYGGGLVLTESVDF
jgi:hypothetical protein